MKNEEKEKEACKEKCMKDSEHEDHTYVKPEIVRVRRVVAAGGHKV